MAARASSDSRAGTPWRATATTSRGLDAVAGQLDRGRLHRGHSITSAPCLPEPPAKIDGVGKVWVLDTETKGTGAQMVPLEKTLRQPASEPVRRVPAGAERRREAEAEPARRGASG